MRQASIGRSSAAPAALVPIIAAVQVYANHAECRYGGTTFGRSQHDLAGRPTLAETYMRYGLDPWSREERRDRWDENDKSRERASQ